MSQLLAEFLPMIDLSAQIRLTKVAVLVRSYNKITNYSIVGNHIIKTYSQGELKRDDNA